MMSLVLYPLATYDVTMLIWMSNLCRLFMQYWYLTVERYLWPKTKISSMAAILDWTKLLLDIHQGTITQTMFMHDHVQVTLLSTEIWQQKSPSWQSPKSALQWPYWIRSKFYLTCIKNPTWVMTVSNTKEIHSFMSEIWLRNCSYKLSMGNM